jgi:NADH-quinone oxidoreductase subunit E
LLTEEEREEIMREIRKHTHKRTACVEAMKIVQRNRGWVSDEISDIAGMLDMSETELEGVATFFSHIYTRPVGKYVIFICDSISCWLAECESLLEYLAERLGIRPGETTKDEQFTLMPIACLGVCERAPAMLIDDQMYTELTPEKIDDILRKYE